MASQWGTSAGMMILSEFAYVAAYEEDNRLINCAPSLQKKPWVSREIPSQAPTQNA